MARKGRELAKQYGLLKVLESRVVFGRRMVLCECECGTKVEVFAFALKSGSTASCGAYACKYKKRGMNRKISRDYGPTGTVLISDDQLTRAWRRVQAGDTRRKVADDCAIRYSTFCAMMNRIERAGGIKEYLARVQKHTGITIHGKPTHGALPSAG